MLFLHLKKDNKKKLRVKLYATQEFSRNRYFLTFLLFLCFSILLNIYIIYSKQIPIITDSLKKIFNKLILIILEYTWQTQLYLNLLDKDMHQFQKIYMIMKELKKSWWKNIHLNIALSCNKRYKNFCNRCGICIERQ